MNIFVQEIIVGFLNYVCVPCVRIACDLELLYVLRISTFCSLMICSWRIWWKKWMPSPEKKCRETQVHCHLCMDSQLRTSALVICTFAPAWVDIQNLGKWFIMNTLVQSTKEVWASVASYSLYHQGYSFPGEGFFLAPSLSSAICAKGAFSIKGFFLQCSLGCPNWPCLASFVAWWRTD